MWMKAWTMQVDHTLDDTQGKWSYQFIQPFISLVNQLKQYLLNTGDNMTKFSPRDLQHWLSWCLELWVYQHFVCKTFIPQLLHDYRTFIQFLFNSSFAMFTIIIPMQANLFGCTIKACSELMPWEFFSILTIQFKMQEAVTACLGSPELNNYYCAICKNVSNIAALWKESSLSRINKYCFCIGKQC